MNNKEIRDHIIDGFDQIAPDVFGDIRMAIDAGQADTEREIVTVSSEKSRKNEKGSRRFTLRKAVAAACALIVATGGAGAYLNATSDAYAAEIYIDANPSIVMEVNEDDQVTEIRTESSEEKSLEQELTSMAGYPISVESAVNMAIDELCSEGYISDDKMDVVISYCYKDVASSEVKEEIDSAVTQSLDDGSYIIQDFCATDELEHKAKKNNITPGKCYYIESLAHDHNMTVEACAHKSIADIQAEADREDAQKSVAQDNSKGSAASGSTSSTKEQNSAAGDATQSTDSKQQTGKQNTKQSSKKSDSQKQSAGKSTSSKTTTSEPTTAPTSTASVSVSQMANAVSVVGAACSSDGLIRIHFNQRVIFSQKLKIIVTDSEGQIIDARVAVKMPTCIKIRAYGVAEGNTYNVTVAGVKNEQSAKYRSVTTSVTARSYKKE